MKTYSKTLINTGYNIAEIHRPISAPSLRVSDTRGTKAIRGLIPHTCVQVNRVHVHARTYLTTRGGFDKGNIKSHKFNRPTRIQFQTEIQFNPEFQCNLTQITWEWHTTVMSPHTHLSCLVAGVELNKWKDMFKKVDANKDWLCLNTNRLWGTGSCYTGKARKQVSSSSVRRRLSWQAVNHCYDTRDANFPRTTKPHQLKSSHQASGRIISGKMNTINIFNYRYGAEFTLQPTHSWTLRSASATSLETQLHDEGVISSAHNQVLCRYFWSF